MKEVGGALAPSCWVQDKVGMKEVGRALAPSCWVQDKVGIKEVGGGTGSILLGTG